MNATRDAQAVKRFFAKALQASHTVTPRVITVDKNAAYPKALKEMKAAGDLAASCELRQSKYRNNLVEQDHRFIQPLVNGWSNQEWASFLLKRHGIPYKDMRV